MHNNSATIQKEVPYWDLEYDWHLEENYVENVYSSHKTLGWEWEREREREKTWNYVDHIDMWNVNDHM